MNRLLNHPKNKRCNNTTKILHYDGENCPFNSSLTTQRSAKELKQIWVNKEKKQTFKSDLSARTASPCDVISPVHLLDLISTECRLGAVFILLFKSLSSSRLTQRSLTMLHISVYVNVGILKIVLNICSGFSLYDFTCIRKDKAIKVNLSGGTVNLWFGIFSTENKTAFADFLLKEIQSALDVQQRCPSPVESDQEKTKETKLSLEPNAKGTYLKTVYIDYIEGVDDTFYREVSELLMKNGFIFWDGRRLGRTHFDILEHGTKESKWCIFIISEKSIKNIAFPLLNRKYLSIVHTSIQENELRVIPLLDGVDEKHLPQEIAWITYLKRDDENFEKRLLGVMNRKFFLAIPSRFHVSFLTQVGDMQAAFTINSFSKAMW